MSVIVTGANGFIGKNLCKSLEGDIKKCDIVGDFDIHPKNLKESIISIRPSCVFHLGGVSSTIETNINKICMNNILLSTEIFNICNSLKIPFVYASSASVYGAGLTGFNENSITSPMNYYAISKDCFDKFIQKKIEDDSTIKAIGLRYFNVYGIGEDHKKEMASPVHKFLETANETNEIKIFEGSEDFYRDFIDVRDVVEITKESKYFNPGIYNVGTGNPRSFLEVAKIIEKITNARIKYKPFPNHLKGKYQKYTCSDNLKINKVSSYNNRYTLEEGIKNVAIKKGYLY